MVTGLSGAGVPSLATNVTSTGIASTDTAATTSPVIDEIVYVLLSITGSCTGSPPIETVKVLVCV